METGKIDHVIHMQNDNCVVCVLSCKPLRLWV